MKIAELEIPNHAERLGQGMAKWLNKDNQFAILAIHYTADESKATPEWKAEASKGYSRRDWLQEFDMSFETRAGRPVYSSFVKSAHVAKESLIYDPNFPVWRGWDIGLHAVVWAQLNHNRLFVFRSAQIAGAFDQRENRYEDWEIDCSGLNVFIMSVKQISDSMFGPDAVYRDIVDPAAFNLNMNRIAKQKPESIFRECGLKPIAGATQYIDVRISLVEDWLNWAPKAEIGFQLAPDAEILIDGMAGGYQFEEEGLKPKKNGFSHCLLKGTPVLTIGGYRPIEDVVIGDYVLTPIGPRLVSATMNSLTNEVCRVVTDCGHTLYCTPDHPFILPSGMKIRADQLTEVCEIVGNESAVPILPSMNTPRNRRVPRVVAVDIVPCPIPKRVYDLTVEQSHQFYANGILVGNCQDALQYLVSKLPVRPASRKSKPEEPLSERDFATSRKTQQRSVYFRPERAELDDDDWMRY